MSKFVMCVKVNGSLLQERENGSVPIPFGSEYSLRFRNKNNRRAVVKFFIDGENVSGDGYVIPANGTVEIERHAETPNKFKFVSLDSEEAQDFGKNGPNADKTKGVIKAQFFLEKEWPRVTYTTPIVQHHHHHHHYPAPGRLYATGILRSKSRMSGTDASDGYDSLSESCRGLTSDANGIFLSDTQPSIMYSAIGGVAPAGMPAPQFLEKTTTGSIFNTSSVSDAELKDGCTVEGSSSNQRFSTVNIEVEDTCTELKIFLQGFDEAKTRFVSGVEWKAPVRTSSGGKKMKPVIEPIAEPISVEEENERLRKHLELLEENAKLKQRIADLQKIADPV